MALSDFADSFPSPSKLLDLFEGRRLKNTCGEEALPLLRAYSVQTKRASAYDFQPGKSGRTSGLTYNHATSARMDDYATHDHTVNHATHDQTINHPTNAGMVDHTTHDQRINHATSSLMDRVEGQTVSYKREIRTVLRVSTGNKPTKAPMNILLGNCRDREETRCIFLSECVIG